MRRKVLVLMVIILVFANIAFVLTPAEWEGRPAPDVAEVAEDRFLVIEPRSIDAGMTITATDNSGLPPNGREPHRLVHECGARRYDISLGSTGEQAVIIDTEEVQSSLIACVQKRASAAVTVERSGFDGARWDMRIFH